MTQPYSVTLSIHCGTCPSSYIDIYVGVINVMMDRVQKPINIGTNQKLSDVLINLLLHSPTPDYLLRQLLPNLCTNQARFKDWNLDIH